MMCEGVVGFFLFGFFLVVDLLWFGLVFLLGCILFFFSLPCWLLSLPWPVFYGEGSWAGRWAELGVCEVLREGKPWQGPAETNLCLLLWAPMLEGLCSPNQLLLGSLPLWEPRDTSPPLTQQLEGVKNLLQAVADQRAARNREEEERNRRIGRWRRWTGRWRIYLLVILGRMLLCQV